MSPKRIPARRSRPAANRSGLDRTGPGTRGSKPRPRKRVRAGSGRTAKSSGSGGADATTRGGSTPHTSTAGGAGVPGGKPAPAPEISERQRRHLRGLAHPLKPIILLGNAGLTDAVAAETARALLDHELIKVKAPGGDRDARDATFLQLAQRTSSTLVHRIGNVAVLYRPSPTLPRILIPDGED